VPWGGTSWPLGESISPVILKAISDSTEIKGYLPNHEVKFVWFDTQCDAVKVDLLPLVSKVFKPDVFIGPPCSVVVEEAVSISELLYGPMKKPILSWGAANPVFADKEKYPMFSRVVASYTAHNAALVALAANYNWKMITILVEQNNFFLTVGGLLQELVIEDSPGVEVTIRFVKPDSSEALINSYLKSAALDDTDAIIVLAYCDIMNKVYKQASETSELDQLTIAVIGFDFNAGCIDPTINMNGFWHLTAKVKQNEETVQIFFDDFADGKWDFTPYVEFPYGSAIPDSEHEEEFKTKMGEEIYTAVPNRLSMDPDYSGYLYDAIVLYLQAMHALLTDSGVDYFADDTPDLTLGMANAYIRSTSLLDGITGIVSLTGQGERRAEVSIKCVKDIDGIYKDIEFATFDSTATNPITWEIEPNEIVWAFGKSKGKGGNDDKMSISGTAMFKIFLSLLTAAITVGISLALYKVRKNAAVAQIEATKTMNDAAETLVRIGSDSKIKNLASDYTDGGGRVLVR